MQQDMIVILDLGSHENTMVAPAVRGLGGFSGRSALWVFTARSNPMISQQQN